MNLMFSNAFKSDEFNLLLCNFALLLLSQISSYSLLFVFAIIRNLIKILSQIIRKNIISSTIFLPTIFLSSSYHLRTTVVPSSNIIRN